MKLDLTPETMSDLKAVFTYCWKSGVKDPRLAAALLNLTNEIQKETAQKAAKEEEKEFVGEPPDIPRQT